MNTFCWATLYIEKLIQFIVNNNIMLKILFKPKTLRPIFWYTSSSMSLNVIKYVVVDQIINFLL